MKTLRRVLVIVIIIAVIGVMVFYKINSAKTYYNDSGVNGNSVSNLYGQGFFCEKDGLVYFANPSDGDALYVMNVDESNVTKLCNDKVYYINVDDHYLYYCRNKSNDRTQLSFLNVNTNALCRTTLNGKKTEILDDGICARCALSGNYIFYHRYDEETATTMYAIGIDGENQRQVFENGTDPRCIVGDYLYYSGVEYDHNIHRQTLSTGAETYYCDDWAWMPTVVASDLYYMDLNDNNRIAKMDASGNKTMISKYGTSDYNVYGNFIYYQTIGAEVDGLYRIDLDTLQEELIIAGQYNSINTTSRNVYFREYSSGVTYHCGLFNNMASVFTPYAENDKK